MTCEHKWDGLPNTEYYNDNGEYVEGYGWDLIIIPAEPRIFRCEKCKTLKKIDSEGEIFYYPPLPNPFARGEG